MSDIKIWQVPVYLCFFFAGVGAGKWSETYHPEPQHIHVYGNWQREGLFYQSRQCTNCGWIDQRHFD